MSSGLELARALWAQVVIVMGALMAFLLIFVPDHMKVSSAGILKLVSWSDGRHEKCRAVSVRREGSTSPISRALLQLLELMNEIPVTSRKYTFTRELVEKLITENAAEGLTEVNRLALEAGFARTLQLLTLSLSDSLQEHPLVRVIKSLPLAQLPFLPLLMKAFTSQTTTEAQAQESKVEAEDKLCQELLWIAQKLKECSTTEVIVHQWTSASRLSAVALAANPRIQKLLITVSAFMCEELASKLSGVGDSVRLKLFSLWMPLFCKVAPSSSEKLGIERDMGKIISSLGHGDREVVLSIWLREFSVSSSDWPDLREYYAAWCEESRWLDDSPLLIKEM